MTSILSRLLTADKPWTAPYLVPVSNGPTSSRGPPQHNVVSGNDFPLVQVTSGRKKKNPRKTQDQPVRFGRVPKREKAKILAAMQQVAASSQERALAAQLEDESRLMEAVVRAHLDTCDFTRDRVAALVESARDGPRYATCPPVLACPLNPAPHIIDNGASQYMEDFSERFAPAIKGVVEFAKRIPGFGFLSQDDQVTLLKAGVFEVLLVRLACMFDAQANSLICLNGQVLRRESLHSASNARFLLDSMFDFAERLNALQLSDSEVGLFCAVVVIAADRPGLRNSDMVMKVQKKMMEILQKSVHANHPEKMSLFGDLMKKIPDLRTLNTLHSEKLLAYKMEPRNRTSVSGGTIDNIADTSLSTANAYSAIPHELWNHYSLVGTHPPCLAPEEDMRSTSPGQHSQHSGSTTGSEWSTTDSKDEHDLVGSPRSISSGLCPEDVKSPVRSSSFSSSRSYVHEEGWTPEHNPSMEYHHGIKRPAENTGSEHGSSSGDEGFFVDSPVKAQIYPKLRRVDSPTDSGIESGKEHGPSTTPTISNCSSPRSSVDEKVKDMDQDKHDSSIEDMPVLKRALQAPPIINPNMLMDEAYRHHKKFRAARREAESPSSISQISLASTHSTLVRTLEQAPRYLSEQQLKRTDLIHNIIMQKEILPGQQPQSSSQTLDSQPLTCPRMQNAHYTFNGVPSSSPASSPSPPVHKEVLLCQNGSTYYVPHSGNVQQSPAFAPTATVSWPFAQQSSPVVTVTAAAQYEQQQNSPHQSPAGFCPSPAVSTSRAGSPSRLLYQSRTPPISTSPLVMNRLSPDPRQEEVIRKNPGETSQPLNLSKKLFAPPLLKMES